jgi:nucleoside-diphosphate-sugar epimerase
MKIAVTGTSGRIGRAIHFALCREHDVVGIDCSVSSVTTHLGEVDNYKLMTKAFKGAEAVVHTAALHAPHVGIYDDSEFHRINIEGTKTVFRAAIDCGVQTLVFTSTAALYGYAAQHPDRASWITETTIPQPKSIYHRTKLEAERFLEAEAGRNLKVTALRMSRCFPEPAPIMAIDRVYDSSLAQQALGWTPVYGFDEVARLLDTHIPEVLPAQAAENLISEYHSDRLWPISDPFAIVIPNL